MVWQKPREIAARVLLRHAGSRSFIEEVLDQELARVRVSGPDRGLIQELCYGTVRWQSTLDWLLERRTPDRRTPTGARVVARLGLYQIFWLDRVPDHAAVHETVEAARALDFASHTGFINALLRGYIRDADATRTQLADLKLSEPHLGWSHPRWLVERWHRRLGDADLQRLLAWNNTPAQTFARVNTIKSDAAALIEAWRGEGVDYDFCRRDWFPEHVVFKFRKHPPIDRLPSFAAGGFYIQDPSTLLAPVMMNAQPGERLLDLCAAPGGKATYLAQLLDNDGRIVAAETDPQRRSRLRENCHRLGADIEVVAPPDPPAAGPFDAVLIDAPCSNTGVLRRRVDVRWRVSELELTRVRKTQQELLEDGARRLRPGGRLIYSTCSLEPEENQELVDAFLAAHAGWRLETARQLDPVRDEVDGAYAARLVSPG